MLYHKGVEILVPWSALGLKKNAGVTFRVALDCTPSLVVKSAQCYYFTKYILLWIETVFQSVWQTFYNCSCWKAILTDKFVWSTASRTYRVRAAIKSAAISACKLLKCQPGTLLLILCCNEIFFFFTQVSLIQTRATGWGLTQYTAKWRQAQ